MKKNKLSQAPQSIFLVLAVCFIILFSINLVSADWFGFDNYYDYNPNTDQVIIRDWSLFGEDDRLAHLKLTWGNTTVHRGIDVHVGTFNLTLLAENSTEIFEALDLINLKSGQVMTRGKQYKVKEYKTEDVYIDSCEQILNETNNSYYNSCEKIENGTKLIPEWIPISNPSFNFEQNIEYEIGVFVDVEANDYGDWITSIYGVSIQEWATWQENLSTGIIAVYRMDLTTGEVNDSVNGTYNGTANSVTRGVTGIVNNSFDFDGAADTDVDGIPNMFSGQADRTYTAWVNHDSGATGDEFINAIQQTDESLMWGIDSSDKLFYRARIGGSYPPHKVSTASVTDDTWVFVAMTWDLSERNVTFYINGSYDSSHNVSAGAFGHATDFCDFAIGSQTNLNWFDGTIDELYIWNRTLDFTEIEAIYDSQLSGCGYLDDSCFGTAPSVTLVSPVDSANLTSASVQFQATVTDPIKIDNVTLYLDGSANTTNTSGFNGSYVFNVIVPEGVHTWSILAINNQSLTNQSENRTFNYTQPPINIELISPIDALVSDVPNINMSCNASNGDGITELNLIINGVVNETVTNTTVAENLTLNKTNYFAEGLYNWTCNATGPSKTAQAANRSFNVTYSSPVITLTSPADNFNTTSQNVTFVFNVTDVNGVQNVSFFLNGTLNQTNTSGISGLYNITLFLSQSFYNWSVSSTSILEKVTNSSNRSLIVHITPPNVTIFDPSGTRGYFLLGDNETLNYSFLEVGQNISEHLTSCWYDYSPNYDNNFLSNSTFPNNTFWDFKNGTMSASQGQNTLRLDTEIPSGNTLLRINTASAISGISSFQESLPDCNNITYSSISSTYSAATEGYFACMKDSNNFKYIIKHDDYGIGNTVNFSAYNLSQEVDCDGNETNFTYSTDSNKIVLFGKDEFGFISNDSSTWRYTLLEINQSFNNETTEGAVEEFTIRFNKSSSLQVSVVSLVYNGTSTSIPYVVSGNYIVAQGSIIIPKTDNDTVYDFYWNITFDDSNVISTNTRNQSVFNINVDNCSSYTNLIYNFTQYDEESQNTILNNTFIELQINLYDTRKESVLVNFSQNFTNINPVQFCTEDSLLTNANYSAYVVVKYWANLTATNTSYSIEYYNILNQTIGNSTVPININLYNLKSDDTTKFRLTFRDSSYVLSPNILVQVYRQYVKDNDFKIVEIPLTDSNGQTILNLVKDTVVYNLVMVNESGNIVGTFNSIIAFCQDVVIGDCTINLAPDSATEDVYDYDEEFDISISNPTYNNVTKKISITFVTGDLLPKTVRMEIVRNNDFGNRSVCTNSLLSSSGTLSCNVSAVTDTDQFLFISIYVDGKLAEEHIINLNAETLNFGTNGIFFAFLFILAIITLFMDDKKVLTVAIGLGWIIVISLGLVRGKIIGFSSAGIWILVTIFIFIWKLNKEDRA